MFGKLPPFHTIAAFEAVARHRSFAKAADELCITQSAVSHRIKTLETRFGTRLLLRSPSVMLTSEGAFLLEAVSDSLSTLEAACSRLARTRRVLKLSTGPAFARNWLLRRLRYFYGEYPDIDVEINATRSAEACLRTGEADVAIRYGTPSDWPEFQHTVIMHSAVFPVCSPDYWHSSDTTVDPAILRTQTLLRTPRQPWKPWFRAAGLAVEEPHHGPLFSDAALMLDAAAQGQGIALARNILVEQDLALGRLIRLSNISIQSEFAYCAIYHAHAVQRSEVVSFLDWLTVRAVQSTARSAEHP